MLDRCFFNFFFFKRILELHRIHPLTNSLGLDVTESTKALKTKKLTSNFNICESRGSETRGLLCDCIWLRLYIPKDHVCLRVSGQARRVIWVRPYFLVTMHTAQILSRGQRFVFIGKLHHHGNRKPQNVCFPSSRYFWLT